MKAHVIENGFVVNTIEVESLDFMPNLVDGEKGGTIGDRYENGVFVKPEIDLDLLAKVARQQRDQLLRDTVDTLNPVRWELITDEQKNAWRAYRKSLLDVPQQDGFPMDVVWPAAPSV